MATITETAPLPPLTKKTVTKKPAAKSLGKGLSALLSQDVSPYSKLEATPENTASRQTLLLNQLQPGAYQPRLMHFREEELEELAQSIRQHGILQPLLVRKVDDNKFEIIAGERRWQSARK